MKYNENFAQKFMNSFMGKKIDEENKKIKIPSIRSMLEELIKIPDEKWGIYAFRREPLRGKFNDVEKAELIVKANQCGKEYAKKIREQFGQINTYEIASNMGIEVEYPQRPNGGGHIIFAQFVEPNKVTVFKDSVDKAIELIQQENLHELFAGKNIEEILLAHEIFHFVEENNENEIFSRTEKIRLWKLGPIKNDSNIVALGEIAGMAFSKELLQISYSPYILDVFLVYLYHKEAAYALYNEIMTINSST